MTSIYREQDFQDTVPQHRDEIKRICAIVNMYPLLQSLLYDLGLLPEQTMGHPSLWNKTVTAVLHMEALRAELSRPSTGE